MKHLVLFTLFTAITVVSYSQNIYTTAQSGSWTSNATWGVSNPSGRPPTSGNCNCKIVIKAGHELTTSSSSSMTISNVWLVLDGPNSVLKFGGFLGNDLTLNGTSKIDIQDPDARIIPGDNLFGSNVINLGGQSIYNSSSTRIPSTAPVGTVQGLASASSQRASPQFQAGILPVKLTNFVAVNKGQGVSLSWTTSTEINSSHFEIERSSDSKLWSTIGKVAASGNVSVEKKYSFSDGAPSNGSNYYRLKIVDIDAQFEYSPIKTISFTVSSLSLVAGPNPATSTLNVTVNQPGDDSYRLRLINRAGQVMFDQKYAASSNRIQLNVSGYTDGTYFLEVTNASGLRQLNKVMIVRK
ncbi:MAG: T9SS type A sorting domain-containing protein [Chitinophagaceae bacterium]|nr:T9SS type A sorting domain-containing protein [Chitinophagaceae bacterium]